MRDITQGFVIPFCPLLVCLTFSIIKRKNFMLRRQLKENKTNYQFSIRKGKAKLNCGQLASFFFFFNIFSVYTASIYRCFIQLSPEMSLETCCTHHTAWASQSSECWQLEVSFPELLGDPWATSAHPPSGSYQAQGIHG